MNKFISPALAIIPARTGSKGVKNKNLAKLGGKSLVELAIECARQTNLFERIVVSSDGDEILSEASHLGVQGLRRPEEFASDTANVTETIINVLGELSQSGFSPEVVVLLEPSCPLRTPEMVKQVIEKLQTHDSVFTVSEVDLKFHPAKQFSLAVDGIANPVCPGLPTPVYRQSLTPSFIRNGAAYGFRTSSFLRTKLVLGTAPYAIVTKETLVNIDTPEELMLAQSLWNKK